MKPISEQTVMPHVRIEPSLLALLTRLNGLAATPLFRVQQDTALSRALRPYLDYIKRGILSPLPEEIAQANLFLFADYFPEDGQLSLIEQVRETIDVHVPEDERAWLDPLKHSYLDLLEVLEITESGEGGRLRLRSLGNGREFLVGRDGMNRDIKKGHVLLTRLIRLPDRALLPGTAIILATGHARTTLDLANQWRREREAESGSFELGEWEDFAKQHGYVLLWMYAQARLDARLKADASIAYRTPSAHPFLYAVALYEHAEFDHLADRLGKIEDLQEEVPARLRHDQRHVRAWAQCESALMDHTSQALARLTLTPALLMVECDSPEHLNSLKHRLASTLGYSLHFIGECITVPMHDIPEVDLSQEGIPLHSMVVTQDEEYRLLKAFLESVYLEWADRPSAALHGLTPRHAAAAQETKAKVASLIDQLEQDDLVYRRTGRAGYDYNVLRAHVGFA
jgi:hypothetical protein